MSGQAQFPALNLYPLNDSFIPKHIVLAGGLRVKIGRQTNAKTVPGEKNGYFDSKVLSRQHAEVWEEGNKIYIKDVKSSNGTFINGSRLSPEGVESQPCELHSEDIVEFGIDIVGEDNSTIIHHKVAAKVQCIFNADDAAAAQQAAYNHQLHQQSLQQAAQQSQLSQARRQPMVQSHTALGQIAPVLRQNKSGLSFDHILSRLQGELQRSRETASELQSLNGAIGDIHEALGGVAPASNAPFPRTLPPVRQSSDPANGQPNSIPMPNAPIPIPADTAALDSLQEQLHQTQSLLSTHVEKVHNLGLETIAVEHDSLKREIGSLRDLVDQNKRDLLARKAMDDDDDDAKSVATVVGVAPFEEYEEENDEERRRRRDELGRPRTPEPSLGDGDSDGEGDIGIRGIGLRRTGTIRQHWGNDLGVGSEASIAALSAANFASKDNVDTLAERLEQLAAQFASTVELSRTLQSQQQEAQEQIALLKAKIVELETVKDVEPQPAPVVEPDTTAFQASLTDFTRNWEGKWERQQEEWTEERERMRRVKEEWEAKFSVLEASVDSVRETATEARTLAGEASTSAAATEKAVTGVSASVDALAVSTSNGRRSHRDRDFVAPPSPRSLSSDSGRPRRKRSSSSPRHSPSPHRHDDHSRLSNGHADPDESFSHSSVGSSASKLFSSNGTGAGTPTTAAGGSVVGYSGKNDSVVRSDAVGAKLDFAGQSQPARKGDNVSIAFPSSSSEPLPLAPHPSSPIAHRPFASLHPSTTTAATTTDSTELPQQALKENSLALGGGHTGLGSDALGLVTSSSSSLITRGYRRRHVLIILYAFMFLLPQPVPYISAFASIGVIMVGVVAWAATNHGAIVSSSTGGSL